MPISPLSSAATHPTVRSLAQRALTDEATVQDGQEALTSIEHETDASPLERAIARATLDAGSRAPSPLGSVQKSALQLLSDGADGAPHAVLGELGAQSVDKLESTSDKVAVADAFLGAACATAPGAAVATVASTASSLAQSAMLKAHANALSGNRRWNQTAQFTTTYPGSASGHAAAAAALQQETLRWLAANPETADVAPDRALSAIGTSFSTTEAVEEAPAALALSRSLMASVGRHTAEPDVRAIDRHVHALTAELDGASRTLFQHAFGAVARGASNGAARSLRIGEELLAASPAAGAEKPETGFANSPANVWRSGIYDWLDQSLARPDAEIGVSTDALSRACATSVKSWVDVAARGAAQHSREVDSAMAATAKTLGRRRKTKIVSNVAMALGAVGSAGLIFLARPVPGYAGVAMVAGGMIGLAGMALCAIWANGTLKASITQHSRRHSELQVASQRHHSEMQQLQRMQTAIDARLQGAPAEQPRVVLSEA